MIIDFGALSPVTKGDCPVDNYQTNWEGWCDCMWPFGYMPNENTRCKLTAGGNIFWAGTRAPGSFFAPWTQLGRVARDLSWPGMEQNIVSAGASLWRFVVDPIGVWNPPDVAPAGAGQVVESGQVAGGDVEQMQAQARAQARAKRNKTLFYVAGGAGGLILLALIARKRRG